ncbi:hypothetical protein NDR87_19730 [Nocardia sp. CDC159]|uniref:Uncharacterized protein n=1 Tax=Nocardia pulmonis TaxID=2951408 RepID=A0A9X2E9G1_9NOCA|nr:MULTISPECIES: hypothetical protein [Nocardia]MCM6776075.1 hypothetical protein [Nocardia pulmonis]MCM6788598.1 hypothetical protein [Nocardia sp. CDC159]
MSISLEEQQRLDSVIGSLVLEEMYEDDNTAELTFEVDRGEITVRLVAETQPIIVPSDGLLQAVGQLVTAHERSGTSLTKAHYRYSKQPSGHWQWDAEYSYADGNP